MKNNVVLMVGALLIILLIALFLFKGKTEEAQVNSTPTATVSSTTSPTVSPIVSPVATGSGVTFTISPKVSPTPTK